MLDIVGKRYLFFGLSLLIIIPGLIALVLGGLRPAIDFTGGSYLEVSFDSGQAPSITAVRDLYAELGYPDSLVQQSGSDIIIVRSKEMEDSTKGQIVAAMAERFNSPVTVRSFTRVGATVGQEVTRSAALAVLVAALGIMAYIWYAFRRVPHAFRYGFSAIVAMFHDIAVVIGVEAILGKLFGWEADALFLTALLTVIGFSVHDTIVVFDRIRENANIYRRLPYETLVNHSIIQTLDRSINTQLTVMITLLALALLGGVTTRHFVIILLIGIFSGTYSSIFNAASILVVWENREWRKWFRRSADEPAA